MKQIRWGMIGCGNVTEVKSGPALQKVEGSTIRAVMSRTGSKARDYARRHEIPVWYDNAATLINDPEIDAVYIATPPNSHKKYTLLCAQAGKDVYVEKPMALNYAECKEMIDACRVAKVQLFVAYYRRALPAFVKIKELIDAGAVGNVRAVNMRLIRQGFSKPAIMEPLPWRVRPEISGGGLFVDLGSHMLDFMDYLLGPIAEVKGFASNQAGQYPAEDVVSAGFRFASGVHGSGLWCFNAHVSHDRTEIIGSDGILSYATFSEEPVILKTESGIKKMSFENPCHVQQPLLQMVVDALLERGTCPSTGVTAARTSQVMDQVLKSYVNKHSAYHVAE